MSCRRSVMPNRTYRGTDNIPATKRHYQDLTLSRGEQDSAAMVNTPFGKNMRMQIGDER